MSETMKVISLEEIQVKAKGVIVPISDWMGEGTINVRLRGIDMTPHLLSVRALPNVLKKEAISVFEGDTDSDELDIDTLDDGVFEKIDDILPIIDAVVKDCLIEPTWEVFEENYPLTQMQKMEIFRFATKGVESLKSFR